MVCEKRELLVLLGLTLVTLAVFANVLQNGFVYDDHFLIVKNKALASNQYFSTIFTHSFAYDTGDEATYSKLSIDYYRPFIRLFFGLCYKAFGLNSAYWHLANLLIFLIVVLLCYFLVRELTDQKVAALATLLFAVHPLHTESVAYVNGSVDTLHAAFFFPSLLLFVLYHKENDRKQRIEYMLGSCFLFLAALLTKELAVTLPPLVATYTLLYTTGGWRDRIWRAVKATIPLIVTFICYCILRASTYSNLSGSATQAFKGRLDLQSTLMTIPSVILEYLRMMLFPVDLNILRSVPEVFSPLSLRFLLTTSLLILIVVVCMKLPARLQMAAAILFVTLVPTLNIGLFPQNRTIQDRYTFIALLGFCILAAELALLLYSSEKTLIRQATAFGMAVTVVTLCLLTVRQNGYWRDNIAIWKRVIEIEPGSPALHCNIASILFYEKRIAEGLQYYRQALKLDPDAVCALKGLASYYQKTGDYKAAIPFWERVIASGEVKDKSLHMMFLAQAYSMSGDNGKALKVVKDVINEFPDYEEARILHSELMHILTSQKRD